ncbi:MAG: PhzF family phenazine biosynthesis protein, partial [Phycisphaerae bacterium]
RPPPPPPAAPPPPPGATSPAAGPLGARVVVLWRARDLMVVVGSEEVVRELEVDASKVAGVDAFAVMVTAPGSDCDFVSRFFAPRQGIAEDPVTGSAHCTLIPYWAERLGKSQMAARQLSKRGGELWCEMRGERVGIGGRVVTYLRGEIEV